MRRQKPLQPAGERAVGVGGFGTQQTDEARRAGPVVPPTGHSTKVAPLARTLSASATSQLPVCMVLMSMNSLPVTATESSPDGPL